MGNTALYDLQQQIDERELAALCGRLVQFNSVNPPGNEAPIAQYVADLLRDAGLHVDVLHHDPDRASLIARLKGSGERPALVFSGHLDTLTIGDAPWQRDPFGGEIADGKVWGRGGSDMKGGDTAMITAVKLLAVNRTPLKGDLLLVLSAGEEKDQIGAVAIGEALRQEPIQGILIPEPTENDVLIAEKGALWLEVTTYGKAGHISRMGEARNAITMMLPILTEFLAMEFPHVEHPILGQMVRGVNMLRAGQKMNTIPDRCRATLEMRIVPGQDHEQIAAHVRQMVAEVGRRAGLPDFRASVELIHHFPPVDTAPDHPFIQRFFEVVSDVTGSRPAPKGISYGTDACVLVPMWDVPFAICGPGSFNATAATDEWVEIERMVEATKIYLGAALAFLA